MRSLTVLKVVDAWKWFAEAEQMYQASLALMRRGHRVAVACQPESPAAERARQVGIPAYPLPGLRGPRLPTQPLVNMARLARLIESLRPDVLHAYRSPPHVLAAAALRWVRGPRPALVRTRAGAQPITRNPLNRALYGRWTHTVLVTSERIRRNLEAGGFGDARIVAVPSVVDPAPLAHADPEAFRRSVGLPQEVPVVGVVGRLAPVKGHRHLIAALPRLLSAHPDLRACLVGPPAELAPEDLLAEARAHGVADRVILTGPRDDVGSALAAFDVVAICSVGSEVISRVLLEAMSLARPVVATTVGVIPEVLAHEETGLLVPPADPEALARAVDRLLVDRALAERFGRRAEAQIRAHHLPEHLAEVLEAVYLEAAGG